MQPPSAGEAGPPVQSAGGPIDSIDMKVLSITYEYPPVGGGGSVVAAGLNQTLVHFGDRIAVVTSRMRGLPELEQVDGVDVHRTWCWRRHRHYTTAPELATTLWPAFWRGVEVMREFRPDVIHTHFVLPSAVVGSALARRFDVPHIVTAHGSDIPGYNPDRFIGLHQLLRPAWRGLVRRASAVTSPSEFLAGLIQASADVPVTVIPNGYEPAPRQRRAKRNMVLLVSRMFPRKGIQYFLEAMRDFRTDWEVVVAGDGPYRATLEQRARDAGVAARFVGFVDKVTLRGLYEEASLLVFPSIQENFPMVLLEAMDAGCAIVTSDAEGCGEVVGDAGFVVRKGDVEGLRRAMQVLLLDPDLRRDLAGRAARRVRQFRWPAIAQQYRELYSQLTGLPAPRPPMDLSDTGVFTTLKPVRG